MPTFEVNGDQVEFVIDNDANVQFRGAATGHGWKVLESSHEALGPLSPEERLERVQHMVGHMYRTMYQRRPGGG